MNGSLPETTLLPRSGQGAQPLVELLRTLADPIRLRILRLLEAHPQLRGGGGVGSNAGGLSVGELGEIMKLPQSTVSRHLKVLGDAGLADARREGTSVYYRLSEQAGMNSTRQLRLVAKSHLDHDETARNDAHRLSAVLRQRESTTESFFGKHAPQWDQLRAKWFGDTFHLEAMLALLNPEWTVADIGTGTGAMLPLLSPHVKRVVAVDPSAAMLKGAKKRVRDLSLQNVEILQGTAENLPLENRSIDVALLALVLAYMPQPAAVLREVRRVLRPGGVVLVIDLQPHEVELFRDELNHHWMGFSQEQIAGWLREAGFGKARWHPLAPKMSRAKEAGTAVPDLFVMRGEAL